MPVYTVHAPVADGTEPRSVTDRFAFIRDGFHFWAFVFGPLWLAWHRLWLALIGYIAVWVGLAVALAQLHVGGGTRFAAMLLFALLMGFEAASLWRWTVSRHKWRQLDVVVADDEETAERRFFDRWAPDRQGLSDDQSGIDRGAPPPTRDIPGQTFSRPPPHRDIIGLFPQPGGSH
ncbi:DUF2628 domain-containing protein [uncultured Bradyrhizobium sp.]|uniref:DUF2628 domain-containing protein n=1 Tax=uncultured Bradyrhizobium sp. TaxID=199684 RepID=UPI0035CAD0F2